MKTLLITTVAVVICSIVFRYGDVKHQQLQGRNVIVFATARTACAAPVGTLEWECRTYQKKRSLPK